MGGATEARLLVAIVLPAISQKVDFAKRWWAMSCHWLEQEMELPWQCLHPGSALGIYEAAGKTILYCRACKEVVEELDVSPPERRA